MCAGTFEGGEMMKQAIPRLRTAQWLLTAILMMVAALGVLSACGDDDIDIEATLEEAERRVDAENSSLINQRYEVTVDSVTDPYIPTDPLFAPVEGNRMVLVTVTVKNSGESPVVASFYDFSLETSDGEMYGAEAVTDIAEDFGAARSPIPGSEETGTLAFEIPAAASPVALWEEIGTDARKVELRPASS